MRFFLRPQSTALLKQKSTLFWKLNWILSYKPGKTHSTAKHDTVQLMCFHMKLQWPVKRCLCIMLWMINAFKMSKKKGEEGFDKKSHILSYHLVSYQLRKTVNSTQSSSTRSHCSYTVRHVMQLKHKDKLWSFCFKNQVLCCLEAVQSSQK